MTFHAAARRQLQYFWPRVVGDTGWELLDSKFGVVAQAANRAAMQASTDDVRDLAGEIEWAKASLISPEDYPAAVAKVGRDIPFDAAKVATVYAGYEAMKARRDGTTLLDFDDLLLHTAAAIENDAAVAQEFRDRYRCFVVDEYQDVTPLQQRVLNAWLGDRDDLTVVGDANQTIYSFTGATPSYLLDFSRRFPDAAVVRLERDYRSTPQVVSLANRVIAVARGRMAGSKLHLIGQRDAGPDADVQRASRRGRRGHRRRQDHQEAHRSRHGGVGDRGAVPHQRAVGGVRGGADRGGRGVPGARRRGLLQPPGDPAGAARAAAGRRARRRGAARTCRRWSANCWNRWGSPPRSRRAPRRASGGRRWPRWSNSSTRRWRCGRRSICAALLAELRQRADARHPPVVQGVTLASLHAAKGLEWDAVFLVGLADGTLPISHALARGADSEQVEEERRLLYVGITRARVHLALSWALARDAGRRQGRRPSRFLNGVAPQAATDDGPEQAAAPARRRRRGAASATARWPRPAVDHVAPLRDVPVGPRRGAAGRSSRSGGCDTSKEMKVPAYVVFTDNTLIAIAETLPADDAALVAIPGIGARKLEQFGPDVLALVRQRS